VKTKSRSRLNAYVAASAGAAAALPTGAEAAIIYFDVTPDLQLRSDQSITFGQINLQDKTYNRTGGGFSFTVSNPSSFVGFVGSGIEIAAEDGYYTIALYANNTINSQLPWDLAAPSTSGDVGNNNYVGLRMDLGGGNYNYGWVAFAPKITIDEFVYTITGFAFQGTPNTPIAAGDVGAIPEPSTVACLLLGGSAFVFSRHRRRESKKNAS
jgi:hypothetical protein